MTKQLKQNNFDIIKFRIICKTIKNDFFEISVKNVNIIKRKCII